VNCARTFIEVKVKEQKPFLAVLCPSSNCSELTDLEVESVCTPEIYQEYLRIKTLTERQRQADPTIWICPTPSCGRISDLKGHTEETISCACQKTWCLCRNEPHPGVTCFRIKFDQHLRNPVEELGYIWWRFDNVVRHQVKDCPSCQIEIMKSGGCNHMTCTSCRHEFCWICLQTYNSSHYTAGQCNGKRYWTETETISDKIIYGAKIGTVTIGGVLLLPFALIAAPFVATYHALS